MFQGKEYPRIAMRSTLTGGSRYIRRSLEREYSRMPGRGQPKPKGLTRLYRPWSETDWGVNLAYQTQMTDTLLPHLENLTPKGGAYLNEADFQQPGFHQVFYGDHYDRLNGIKAKYDPKDIFYALTAVGSERWTVDRSGKLCQTQAV